MRAPLTYIPNSGTQSDILTLEYSNDGTNFSAAPLGEIRTLRWALKESFEPDAQIEMSYQLVVGDTLPTSTPSAPLSSGSSLPEAYTQAMFGHLGVIETGCPAQVSAQITATQRAICGDVESDFSLFRQGWDLYSDYEGEVPIVPAPVTSWRSNGGSYSRDYTLDDGRYTVVYTSLEDRLGSVLIVYEP